MRALVTGAGGMLGRAVTAEAARRGAEVLAMGRADLDVIDARAVDRALGLHRPDVVVHCAGYTNVDAAESAEDEAMALNAVSAALLARAAGRLGALLVYPSTDYVFDGRATRPYRPGDPIAPLNAYGRSKAAGERETLSAGGLVVRTSWLFGAGGRNFVDTVLARAERGAPLTVVDDQIGRPTWTADLASVLISLAACRTTGTFHASGAGDPVTWYGFARAILSGAGVQAAIEPVPTTALARAATRPRYSVLDLTATEEILGRRLESWEGALGRYLAERRRVIEAGVTDG
jgi:dTDP-4-dehydrorhamnose reductase